LVAAAAMVATFIRVIFFTPIDRFQGAAQKIFYVHAPAAWVAFLAFFLVAIASGFYLFLRDERLDRFAESSAEAGVIFTTVVLITGPIWGRPVWGTWWEWEMRLTLTLVLWFVYLAYLVLRSVVDDREMRARYSAVLGMLGALLIPFIHLSVFLFRTQHPLPVVMKTSRPSMPNDMLLTLAIAFFSTTLLYIAFTRTRYAIATARDLAPESDA
jgi:heme exporter protein C